VSVAAHPAYIPILPDVGEVVRLLPEKLKKELPEGDPLSYCDPDSEGKDRYVIPLPL
jgi:hypothetical protein